jgi:hypothetical protein
MSDEVLDRTKYTVSGGLAHPSSVALENDRKHALLTFNQPFISNSYYVLTLTPILDLQGCTLANLGPFDLLTPAFPQQLPYLIQASPTGDGILLEFSAPMNPDTSALIDRYNITYGQNNYLIITSAQPDTNDLRFISLEISPDTPMGPLGFIYTISVHDLYDISNNPINPLYASVTLAFATNSLNQVFAYPNPYRAGDIVDGEHCLVFANLMPQAEIRIFNLSGELVKKLVCDDTFGGVKWYLDNQKGELVGNGIYIYYVSADDEKFMGKVAIMR